MRRRTFMLSAVAAAASGAARAGAAPDLATGPSGGFDFAPAPGAPFSSAVAAQRGFILRRVRLRRARPLAEGFALIAAYLDREGLKGALAGCELRSPKVLSRPDFDAFNVRYVAALRAAGLLTGDLVPAARSNMVPLFDPPATPVLHAFTIAAPGARSPDALGPDFLISGKPEEADPPVGVIAPNDVTSAGMSRKAAFVIASLKETAARVGGRWEDVNGAHVYSRRDLGGALKRLGDAGLARVDLALVPGDPPLLGRDGTPLDFEVDVRAVTQEVQI